MYVLYLHLVPMKINVPIQRVKFIVKIILCSYLILKKMNERITDS